MSVGINGYELTNNWYLWCSYNLEKIKPTHSAIYFYAVHVCNKLGWMNTFGFPTDFAMAMTGISNWRTYNKHLLDLVDWGFIQVIKKSPNRYQATIISIVPSTELNTELNTMQQQCYLQDNSSASAVIDKPNKHLNSNKPLKTSRRVVFTSPKLYEVEQYVIDNNYQNVNPNKFWNHYESNGWMVGKNKMKDWKAALRKWGTDDKSNSNFNKQNNNQNEQREPRVNGQTITSAAKNSIGFG
ncbi:MAG: hypothetical protein KDC62_08760 [Aequorivita sp.]|nr:hypothetical protein [Aequorivita sp.]